MQMLSVFYGRQHWRVLLAFQNVQVIFKMLYLDWSIFVLTCVIDLKHPIVNFTARHHSIATFVTMLSLLVQDLMQTLLKALSVMEGLGIILQTAALNF